MADKQQAKAINHGTGPALILAGPGSGKTYVLTHHISFLINSLGISPEKILVLTFTKEAAKNMKTRFMSLCKDKANDVTFGTFHSVFYKFLCYCYGNRYKIIGGDICRKYISDIIDKPFQAEEIISLISKYKSHFPLPSIETFDSSFDNFQTVYTEYMSLLKDRNELDYDDILLKCYELIVTNTEFRTELSKRYTHILIDEFQDISEIQYEIIKSITTENSHVFAVGDEDQSIYSFRGASKDIMRRFLDDYINVNIIELGVNYRSSLEISEMANSLIVHNTGRLKNIRQSCLFSDDDSAKVKILSKSDNSFMILKSDVDKCREQSLKCGILVRTNKDAEKIRKMLLRTDADEDSEIINKVSGIFYSYLNFSLYGDRNEFFSILNIPDRFLETSLFHSFPIDFEKIMKNVKSIKKKNEIILLKKHLSMLQKCTAVAFCLYLWNVVGIKTYIEKLYCQNKDEFEACINIIYEMAKESDSKENLLSKLEKLKVRKTYIKQDNLDIMTYHASKGLEFDAVFLPDVVEGHVPGRSGILQAGIEEERRLFYVAMTRAKKKLYIYSREDKENHSVLPSRFIGEMLDNKSLPD